MTLEANRFQGCDEPIDLVAAAAYTGGQVVQLGDGRAAVYPTDIASGALGSAECEGIFTLQKTASIVILDGGRVYWDHSANKAHFKRVNDKDFYVGRAVGDSSASATTVKVNFNIDPRYDIDLLRDPALSVPTGTQAVGGFGYPKQVGGSQSLELTATSEAQCIDLLSVDKFVATSKGITDFEIRPDVNGSGAAVDFNCGIANGTSTTDADAITEHVLFHIDGGATDILAQSKDGTTTVAAADTGADITAGTAVANRVYLTIDHRANPVVLYVNGVAATLPTTATLAAATGQLGILVHLEKTTGTTTGKFTIDRACTRLMEQAAA
jgi:predicted RecA/RadA family phage recombinase